MPLGSGISTLKRTIVNGMSNAAEMGEKQTGEWPLPYVHGKHVALSKPHAWTFPREGRPLSVGLVLDDKQRLVIFSVPADAFPLETG